MYKKVIGISILFLIIYSSSLFAEDANLVRNPGFEDGTETGFYNWTKHALIPREDVVEFQWDANARYSGKKSVCIFNKSSNYTALKQVIPVKRNTRYILSCRIKTENVGLDFPGANLLVDGIGTNVNGDLRGTTGTWKLVTLDVKTTQFTETLTISLELGAYGNPNTGKAWFDDVTMKETDLNSDPFGKISETTAGNGGGKPVFLVLLGLFLVAIIALIVIVVKTKKSSGVFRDINGTSGTNTPETNDSHSKLNKVDIVMMIIMTLIYLVIALYNLGKFNAPKTFWAPVKAGENYTVCLDRPHDLSKIYYYCGLGKGKFTLEYLDQKSGKYLPLAPLPKEDVWVFMWRSVKVKAITNRIKVTVQDPGGALSELCILEKGGNKPLKVQIEDNNTDPQDIDSVKNLFDEQNFFEFPPSYLSGTYFDEVHHARTAYEYLHQIQPHEDTHPPLGKILIAAGIAFFGMVPFGWRIVGTLFGAAMIPLMYLFGKQLFGRSFYAFCAAYLMMFDFMHFQQTRIGTVDVYAVTFIILMYYFLLQYYTNQTHGARSKQSLNSLFWCGLFLGLGVAVKWISLYAGAGLILIIILIEYWRRKNQILIPKLRQLKTVALKRGNAQPDKINPYFVLFLVIMPLIIYILSYIPFMLAQGHGLGGVLENQFYMLNYHSTDPETHRFSTQWWEWPLITRPMWFFNGPDLPENKISCIVAMGNPAVWWLGILAMVFSVIMVFKKRDRNMLIVVIAFLFQYLPWILISRAKFIYHFFSEVPFMILLIVFMFKYLMDRFPKSKFVIYYYLVIVAILFVMFYPVLSGMVIDKSYVNQFLSWFKGWVF